MKAFKAASLIFIFALFGAGNSSAQEEQETTSKWKELGSKAVKFTIEHRKEIAEVVKTENRYAMEVEFALLFECIFEGPNAVTQNEYEKRAACCVETLKGIESKYPSTEKFLEAKVSKPIGASCRN